MADAGGNGAGGNGAGGAVGLVASGAGARGAYEAGALSVLLPCLERREQAPTVLVGTSAGALNVVGLAALLDRDQPSWVRATQRLVELWRDLRFADVADLRRSVAGDATAYLGQLIGFGGRLPSLLDTRRLHDTLAARVKLDVLHENVAAGPVDAVAVATTSVTDGSTVVFVEKKPAVPLPPRDVNRNIRYVETRLTLDHVLASAAVPVAFRPVTLPDPAGWYVDGGVRLNTPLKPAIRMGCDRLAVVSTHPATWPRPAVEVDGQPPDVFGAAALVLRSLLNDRAVEDLRTLSRVNRQLGRRAAAGRYRQLEFVLACPPPEAADALGRAALEVAEHHDGPVDLLRDPDLGLLTRLVGSRTLQQGELLSFLLFDGEFTERAAGLGVMHTEAAVGPCVAAVPWRAAL